MPCVAKYKFIAIKSLSIYKYRHLYRPSALIECLNNKRNVTNTGSQVGYYDCQFFRLDKN